MRRLANSLPILVVALWLQSSPAHAQAADSTIWLMLGLPITIFVIGFAVAIIRGMGKLGVAVAELNRRDALTGLLLPESLVEDTFEWLGPTEPLASRAYLFVLRVDDMAKLNETYGVIAMDEALCGIARILGDKRSGGEPLGRWQGRKFAGAFRAKDDDAAQTEMRGMQAAIENLDIKFGGAPVAIGASAIIGRLPGSRADDVRDGYMALVRECRERLDNQTGVVILKGAVARKKRSFFRDDAEPLGQHGAEIG